MTYFLDRVIDEKAFEQQECHSNMRYNLNL